jgi:hypothetical protein
MSIKVSGAIPQGEALKRDVANGAPSCLHLMGFGAALIEDFRELNRSVQVPLEAIFATCVPMPKTLLYNLDGSD